MGYNMYTKSKKNVLFASIEMPKGQLEGRLDSLDADISYEKLKLGKLSPEEEQRYITTAQNHKNHGGCFYIYDIQGICTPSILTTKIGELAAQFKFDVVIIDYLNIIQSDTTSNTLWEEQGKIADQIRKIARTMRIPILTAVQINREGMKGKTDRYEQQHIALSQFIVNHADTILSIKVTDPTALEISDVVELNCWFIKNRDGARKSFKIIAVFDRFRMAEPVITIPSATI
jgi:replicative DNA helicase